MAKTKNINLNLEFRNFSVQMNPKFNFIRDQ